MARSRSERTVAAAAPTALGLDRARAVRRFLERLDSLGAVREFTAGVPALRAREGDGARSAPPRSSIPISPACRGGARRREWMGQVEAVIFASAEPVPRETLARLVGPDCRLDELIADIQDEPRQPRAPRATGRNRRAASSRVDEQTPPTTRFPPCP